ncbi:MAG: glycosyltransferase involved in cell wall biosynthesis [Kiritimatiellia bacterium]|jgi:polyisoprenyl-phosphate glycosyltransferase
MSRKALSLVLPVFNEEDNVKPFFEALHAMVQTSLTAYDVEYVFVDDGSQDQTLERVKVIADVHDTVRVISFSRNFGHQAALTAGMERASGDAVVTMDTDFQDPVEVIPKLVAKWEAGNQIVYARRVSRTDKAFKKWSADLYYRILSGMSDVDIPRQVGDFRLIDRIVLKNLTRLDEHARYLRGMVAWLGFKHDFVDFDRPDRLHGETHYPFRKMFKLAMDGILNFSFTPLKIGLWVGITSILISMVFLGYMTIDTLFGPPAAKYELYKWLVVVLFGFVGAQFILLWIIGEYIGRIYSDVRRRPLYVVNEEINLNTT